VVAGVADARKLQRLVHLGGEGVDRDAGAPLVLGPEIDDGLEHLDRRRIGRRGGAAGFAEHRCHLGKAGSFAVRQKGQRVGRNPKTAQEVPISPRRVLVFRASHALKDQINHGLAEPIDSKRTRGAVAAKVSSG